MTDTQTQTTGFYAPPPVQENSGSVEKKPVNKINQAKKITKYALTSLALLLLIGGGLAGYLLSQQPQDVRQQASTGTSESPVCSISFVVPSLTPFPTIGIPTPPPNINDSPTPPNGSTVTVVPTSAPTVTPQAEPTITSTPSVTLSAPSVTPTVSLTPTVTPVQTFSCNSDCETDADCQTVNAEYICSATYGNKCRLDANRESDSCQPVAGTFSCNSSCSNTDECRTANSNYTCSSTYGNVCRLAANEGASNCLPVNYVEVQTSLAGCNQSCETNANCAYTNYICYSTSSGNVCRLDQYPNSSTCNPPAVVNAYVPAPQQIYIPAQQVVYVQQNPAVYSPVIAESIPTPALRDDYTPYVADQPALPEELPQTGPADWTNWLKAGLVTLGLGGALLLLL